MLHDAHTVSEVTARLERVGLADDAGTCSQAAACPALPANVLSLIGQHMSLEERLVAGGTCKLWRTALHEGITLLEFRLDDGSCADARRHSTQAWARLLAAAGAVASSCAARARVELSGNLMTRTSLALLMSGLAAHRQLQHLSVLQVAHRSGHALPARPCAHNGRLRRKARWARPPLTVFPSLGSGEMHPLCRRLPNLVSLSLRECLFLQGFDTWMLELTKLQRLELVPAQDHVCQHVRSPEPRDKVNLYFPRQMRFCLSTSSWPAGRSAALTSLTLGGALASPADLAALASRLPRLKALRLEAVPLDEYGRTVPATRERHSQPAARLPHQLGTVLRESFTHLDVLDVCVCFSTTHAPVWTLYDSPASVCGLQLEALESFLTGLAGVGGSSSCGGSGSSHGSSADACGGGSGDGSIKRCWSHGTAPRAALRLAGSYDAVLQTERPEIARLLAAIFAPDTLQPRVITVGGRRYGVIAEVDRERGAAGLAAWLPLSEAEAAWQRARLEAAAYQSYFKHKEPLLESYMRRWWKR
ncbi:hypothetical protein HXX76_012372 [Chlamydomonas incerta]|uniref:F-box domain-containing protein n=1 Tax=Chlamydomonas incerta TaxID=51695 RepID=A0A835VW88_CHLIN|nr:hypothetical protein HXX76_012372 [Chlamydomonas incerta]|eukprot:KAG2427436.1 hypothetical protein HXX76_012372 [Chlamydomonas incerta]